VTALLRVRDLAKRFGRVVALDGVSLDLESGEWLAVLGPSGSGKSTLLHCLAQLQEADSGSVVLDGAELTTLAADEKARLRREALGIVFQQFHMLPYLTAVENVMLAQFFHSMADRAEAEEALRRVGLGDRLQHLPRELSGGEQQRCCVARALINRPKLLLADEPTGSLDRASRDAVLDLFTQLHGEGHAIITVTHDPAVGRRADKELLLEHGRVSGSVAAPRDAESELDLVLERAWAAGETGGAPTREALSRGLGRRAFDACVARTHLVEEGARVTLLPSGRARAREVVRRRRLAERLVQQALHGAEVERPGGDCPTDHLLAPEAVDATCAFLGHPRTCPHDRVIPDGPCCRSAAAADPGGRTKGPEASRLPGPSS
jgi:putative ABC transport system ATP-binding protein